MINIRTKSNRRLVAVALIVLIAAAVITVRRRGGEDGVTYEFGTVTHGNVRNSVSATGTIQPWKVVDIKSNVAGRLDKLTVDLGDTVQAGQLIALIDPTDPQVAVTQARSDVASAQANVVQTAAASTAQPSLTKQSILQAEAGLISAQKSVSQSIQSKQQLEEQLSSLQDVTIPQSLESAKGDLEQASANVDAQQAEYSRQQQLLAKGYSSKSEVEAAFAKLATLKAALNNAKQHQSTIQRQNQLSIRQLKAQIAQASASIEESRAREKQQEAALASARTNSYLDQVRREQYKAAKSQVIRSRAELKQATTTLSYTRITAPRSGIVITKNVEEGTVVPSSRGSIGSTNALLQIGDTSQLWVVCQVDETDIAQVLVGQKVSVMVDAYPDLKVRGRVIRIDPQAKLEQNVTTIPVTVEVRNPDPRFKPGMNVDCTFIVSEVKDVLVVPNEALKQTPKGAMFVQTLVEGKPKDVPITTGLSGDEVTEVKSGNLHEGQEIITRINLPEKAAANNPLGFGPPGRRGQGGGQGSRSGSGGGGTGGRAGGTR